MSFFASFRNSILLPPLVALASLIWLLLFLFPSPMIWFLVTLYKTVWPFIALGMFWGSLYALGMIAIISLIGMWMPNKMPAHRWFSTISLILAGTGLSVCLKFVLMYEGAIRFWPTDTSSIVINIIAGVVLFIIDRMAKAMNVIFISFKAWW